MVARFRTAIALGARFSGRVAVDACEPESRAPKASWTRAGRPAYVNPDGFLVLNELDRPDGRAAFFLEADRSTMSLKRLRQKYAFYSALRAERRHQAPPFSIPGFRVLTVCKTNERA